MKAAFLAVFYLSATERYEFVGAEYICTSSFNAECSNGHDINIFRDNSKVWTVEECRAICASNSECDSFGVGAIGYSQKRCVTFRAGCTRKSREDLLQFPIAGCVVPDPLVANTLLTTIPRLYENWSVSFLVYRMGTLSTAGNVLHLTTGGDWAYDNQGYGYRVPAVFFESDSETLGVYNENYADHGVSFTTSKIPLNQWTFVEVTQADSGDGTFHFSVKIDDQLVNSAIKEETEVFESVKVYTSNPWHAAANAKIRNLEITTFSTEESCTYTTESAGCHNNAAAVDECTEGTASCPTYSKCRDTSDSYECDCNEGFEKSGEDCIDIDECSTDPCDENATCTNLVGSHTCTCNKEYDGDGTVCTPYSGRCPSKSCWTYDSETAVCTLNRDCTSVQCDSTKMTIFFDEYLFNSADLTSGASGIVPAAETNTGAVNRELEYMAVCTLGECGMTPLIDGANLNLSLRLQKSGQTGRQKQVDADTVVIVSPDEIDVLFECNYPTSVSVSSGEFGVDSVSITGATTSSGDLTSGFAMALVNPDAAGSSSRYILGRRQGVEVSWSVTISDISFVLAECVVTQNAETVHVVKGNCYSELLKATREVSTDSTKSMSYQTFRIDGAKSDVLNVGCTVQICTVGNTNCQNPTTCPDDAYMQFSIMGY